MNVTDAIEKLLLDIAYRDARDFLSHIGYDGDVCMGYVNEYGQDLEDVVQVLDD